MSAPDPEITAAADDLARWWETRTNAAGQRETYDPFAGLWLTDEKLVANERERSKRKPLLGDYHTAHSMNMSGD